MSSTGTPPPQWYPADERNWHPRTQDWAKLITEYVWALRNQQTSLNQTVQNFNNNISETITKVFIDAGNNNNSPFVQNPPVLFGTHAQKLTTAFSPAAFNGYLFVETDRFSSTYYSNGVQWVLMFGVSVGSFENRYTGLNSFDAGSEWIETSRNNQNGVPPYVTYRWDGANWAYISGEFYRNQNGLSTLAGTFLVGNNNGNDVGALVNVVDFAGQLQWQANNNWAYGPADDRMHGMGPLPSEIDRTGQAGWHAYDGSTVPYLQANGSTANVSLANLTGAANVAFLEFGNVSSGNTVNPAVAPTFTGGAASGSVSVSVSLNSSSANFTANNNGSAALTSVTVSSATGNFTGNNVTGTVSNNAVPPNIVRRAWFRQ